MRWGAVEESVCQWCGARIYLVRVSINNWEWVTDLKRPRATWKCYADAEWPAARLHQPVLLDRRTSDRASMLRNGGKMPKKGG
jgi:hypothetical protein